MLLWQAVKCEEKGEWMLYGKPLDVVRKDIETGDPAYSVYKDALEALKVAEIFKALSVTPTGEKVPFAFIGYDKKKVIAICQEERLKEQNGENASKH